MHMLRLQLKVIAGAAKNSIEWYGDKLKVKVNAVAERGKANEAVLAALAERLGLAASALTLVAGHTTPMKVVEIAGLTEYELMKLIPR